MIEDRDGRSPRRLSTHPAAARLASRTTNRRKPRPIISAVYFIISHLDKSSYRVVQRVGIGDSAS